MSASTSAPARDRLRIAIQKSGRLADPARSLLAACGLSWRQSRDKLFCFGESLPVDLLLVRDDDIPGLIADGVCDLGVVGLNELDEQAKARRQIGLPDAYQPLRGLGFGQCRLMIAVPDEWEWRGVEQLAGKRIATSYPAILAAWLKDKNVDAQVVELSGSVEIAPKLGTAELICDLVSSGATLAANQPKFKPDNGYWRGPIWLDQSYFGINGLEKYGYQNEANQLAHKLIHNAEGALKKGKSIRENYNPITGKGLEGENFSWSAAHYLMLLLKN